MKILPIVGLTVILMSGCATQNSREAYQPAAAEAAATIQGDIANPIRFFSRGEAHTHIVGIDGKPVVSGGKIPLAPGKHLIRYSLAGKDYLSATGEGELTVVAGDRIRLQGHLVGEMMKAAFVNLSHTPPTVVLAVDLWSTKGPGPASIPIFIPIR